MSERQRAGARRRNPEALGRRNCIALLVIFHHALADAKVASTVHTVVPGNPRLPVGIPAASENVDLPATASCRKPCALSLEPEGGGGWVNTRRAALILKKLRLAAHRVAILVGKACLRSADDGVCSVGFVDHDINLARPHGEGVTRISAVERARARRSHHAGGIDARSDIHLPLKR